MKSTNFPIFSIIILLAISYLLYENYKLKEEIELKEMLFQECVNDPNFGHNYKKFQNQYMNDAIKNLNIKME